MQRKSKRNLFIALLDDRFSSESIHYAATDIGFILYSVGPNGVDDGGQDENDEDIAWRYPGSVPQND